MGLRQRIRRSNVENVATKIPDDFVISTNKTYTVKMFVERIFKRIGIKIVWKGKGVKEEKEGLDGQTGKSLIEIDPFTLDKR